MSKSISLSTWTFLENLSYGKTQQVQVSDVVISGEPNEVINDPFYVKKAIRKYINTKLTDKHLEKFKALKVEIKARIGFTNTLLK